MKKLLATSLIIGFGFALTACQTLQQQLTEEGAVKMDKAAVEALLSGKTITWGDIGGAYHAADGTYEPLVRGEKFKGTWSVAEDGTFCRTVPEWSNGETKCMDTYYMDKDGQTVKIFDGHRNEVYTYGPSSFTDGNTL